MLIGVMDGLTLQWLSFDSSAEDMLTEPYVKMLQSANAEWLARCSYVPPLEGSVYLGGPLLLPTFMLGFGLKSVSF
jgi:hypothetical protein